ncbi:unnamed protein product, partial [Coregonus sp. 'balchen']
PHIECPEGGKDLTPQPNLRAAVNRRRPDAEEAQMQLCCEENKPVTANYCVPIEEKKPGSEAVAEYLEGKKKYEDLKKQKLKKGSSREAQTMALLDRFKSKLMAHVLQFDEQTRKVKDANMQDEDTFEIYDPRNPVNKRRREESKKIMMEKKAKK